MCKCASFYFHFPLHSSCVYHISDDSRSINLNKDIPMMDFESEMNLTQVECEFIACEKGQIDAIDGDFH